MATAVGTAQSAPLAAVELGRQAEALGLSFDIQLPDRSRKTLQGPELTRLLASGVAVQTELGIDPQDFQALVARAVARDRPNQNIRVDRNALNAFMSDGVDDSGNERQLNRLIRTSESTSTALRPPETSRIGSRPSSRPLPELRLLHCAVIFLHDDPRIEGDASPVREQRSPEQMRGHMRQRAQAFLSTNASELRPQISPPIARSEAEQRLRTVLERFNAERPVDHQFDAGQIRRFATVLYDESLALWGDTPTTVRTTETRTSEDRQAIVQSFLRGMPDDPERLLAVARLTSHPLLNASSPDILRSRLEQIARDGYRAEDISALAANLQDAGAAIAVVPVSLDQPVVVRQRQTFTRDTRLVANGALLGGDAAVYSQRVATLPAGTTRTTLLERTESNAPEVVLERNAYITFAPTEQTAAVAFANEVATGRVPLSKYKELSAKCTALASGELEDTSSFWDTFMGATLPPNTNAHDLTLLVAKVRLAEEEALDALAKNIENAHAEVDRDRLQESFATYLLLEQRKVSQAIETLPQSIA